MIDDRSDIMIGSHNQLLSSYDDFRTDRLKIEQIEESQEQIDVNQKSSTAEITVPIISSAQSTSTGCEFIPMFSI